MEIAIITPGALPIPAVKGGAIETLIENLIKQNEINEKCHITIYSVYNKEAIIKAEEYNNTEFLFIKRNKQLEVLHYFFMRIFRKLFKTEITYPYIEKILKDLRKKNFEKIIIEGPKEYVLPVKKRMQEDKVYLHIHYDGFNDNHMNNEKIIKSCNKIITVSNYIKKQTVKIYDYDEKVVVLKNCTDTNLFDKDKYINDRNILRDKYGIEKDEVVILFSGRILPIKGIKELILSFKQLPKNTKAKLLIVGNAGFGENTKSEYDDELSLLSQEIKEKIVFTGFIHNSEMPKIHAMSDIAVIPSIWDDPAPLVVFEAMSSGLPLVVTDSGGIPEYVCDECAIIVKRDNNLISNLNKALFKLISNEKLRNEMGQAGKIHVQQYNIENYYNDFIGILKD